MTAERDRAGRRRRPDGDDRPDLVYGRRTVAELLRSGASVERVFVARDLARSPLISEIQKRAESSGSPVRVVPKAEIERLVGHVNHQGVAAVAGSYRYASFEDLLARPEPALLFLDGVMDPHNLGSLLRSADGAGFDGIVIRSRRSVQVTPAVRRTSAGASEVVPVARVTNLGRALDQARSAGLWAVGLDAGGDRDIWASELLAPPVAVVLGSEDRGLSPNVRQRCDDVCRIPSVGKIDSLNVAIAGAVAMFETHRRRGSDSGA